MGFHEEIKPDITHDDFPVTNHIILVFYEWATLNVFNVSFVSMKYFHF